MTQTPPRTDPLGIPGVVRIPLEPGQAKIWEGLGECLAVIGQASYPNAPGWCLLALPVTPATAQAACKVALGECRATKIKAVSVERRANATPPRTV